MSQITRRRVSRLVVPTYSRRPGRVRLGHGLQDGVVHLGLDQPLERRGRRGGVRPEERPTIRFAVHVPVGERGVRVGHPPVVLRAEEGVGGDERARAYAGDHVELRPGAGRRPAAQHADGVGPVHAPAGDRQDAGRPGGGRVRGVGRADAVRERPQEVRVEHLRLVRRRVDGNQATGPRQLGRAHAVRRPTHPAADTARASRANASTVRRPGIGVRGVGEVRAAGRGRSLPNRRKGSDGSGE